MSSTQKKCGKSLIMLVVAHSVFQSFPSILYPSSDHLLCSSVVLSALFTQRTACKTVSSDATQYNIYNHLGHGSSSGVPEKLCRICDTITTAHRVTYLCSDHTDGLRDGLKVNVLDDDPEIHPKKICKNGYCNSKAGLISYDHAVGGS